VTQRRWLAFCNPPLRKLITKTLGNDEWILHLDNLRQLSKHADDPAFQVGGRGPLPDSARRRDVASFRLSARLYSCRCAIAAWAAPRVSSPARTRPPLPCFAPQQEEWRQVKHTAKVKAAALIERLTGAAASRVGLEGVCQG
jgi:hypothetical protein